jgi:hypothetical protein
MPNDTRTPTENPALLLMLDGNPTLQTLIATWPNAWRSGAKKHEQVVTWAAVTGLRPVEVANAWRTLFENGFCRRDGTVDEFAAKYLASLAMSRLPAAALKRKEKDDGR